MEPSNDSWRRVWRIIADAASEIEKIARENANAETSSPADAGINDERLAYSISEAAKLLGRTHTYVRRRLATGEIKAIDSPGRTLISRKELNRFLGSSRLA